MTVEYLYRELENVLYYVERMSQEENDGTYSVDYLKGLLNGVYRVLSTLAYRIEDEKVINNELTEEEQEQYAYDEDWVADGFAVALNNNVYAQMSDEVELIEEGKTYHSHIKPWGLLTFGDEVYPVYSDDAGQCDYIRINGENFSGGTYNFFPEHEFIRYIISHKIEEAIEKLERKVK